jgi:predicted dehydrogenase
MSAPIRIGMLGAAAIAPAALINPARNHRGVEVTALAARDADRARQFADEHDIPRVLGSYDAIVNDPRIDAVYIPLPNGLHGRWMHRALDGGKHVLCEKPFTANATEAAGVADHARTSGLVVMEAFHWRYHPMAQRMIDIVRSGELGRIEHIDAALCFPLLKPSDIRYRLDLAGGALLDAGCYAINMLRSVIGAEPVVIDGQARMTKRGVDRAFKGHVQFPDGVTGTMTCSLFSTRLLSLHVRVDGERGTLRAFNPVMPKLFGHLTVEVGGRRRVEEPAHTDTYRHQLDAFADAITDGRPFPSTADDAVLNMKVIDDFYRAAGLEPRQPVPLREGALT